MSCASLLGPRLETPVDMTWRASSSVAPRPSTEFGPSHGDLPVYQHPTGESSPPTVMGYSLSHGCVPLTTLMRVSAFHSGRYRVREGRMNFNKKSFGEDLHAPSERSPEKQVTCQIARHDRSRPSGTTQLQCLYKLTSRRRQDRSDRPIGRRRASGSNSLQRVKLKLQKGPSYKA